MSTTLLRTRLALLRVPATSAAQPHRLIAARRALHTTSPLRSSTIYTAHATVTGARSGHIVGDEGITLDLTTPSSMGGKSVKGKTNPEELFAAGYGACFQSAMNAVAPSFKIRMPNDTKVDCSVSLVGDMKNLDIGLKVDMTVTAKGVDRDVLQKLVEKTKEVCPYSRATKGNVETTVTAVVE